MKSNSNKDIVAYGGFRIDDTVRRINDNGTTTLKAGTISTIVKFVEHTKENSGKLPGVYAVLKGYPNIGNAVKNLELCKSSDKTNFNYHLESAIQECVKEITGGENGYPSYSS